MVCVISRNSAAGNRYPPSMMTSCNANSTRKLRTGCGFVTSPNIGREAGGCIARQSPTPTPAPVSAGPSGTMCAQNSSSMPKKWRVRNVNHHPEPLFTRTGGGQYTSWIFGHRLREAGFLGSMGKVASSVDNALIESFWSSMQAELLLRQFRASRA